MKQLVFVALLAAALGCGSAAAQQILPLDTTCELHAMDKNGKPLAGAARSSFINKCKREMCAGKAIGDDGRPLVGAAKANFMKNCEEGR
jgi:hypothetical protein